MTRALPRRQEHTPGESDSEQGDRRSPSRSDVSTSAVLPPRPTVFHGRNEVVNRAVHLLLAPGTVSLAVLGPGGIGKTSIALALLHHSQIVKQFDVPQRLFLSCEALVDADAIVIALAKQLQLPVSADLLTTVVTYFARGPRAILVLDNLETAWLAGGAPVSAVDELLGRLAQIPTLSLVITCRGTDLPQSVEWSNSGSTILEPFSLEAALQTFRDRAGSQLTDDDMDVARQLVNAVDRMPLAVSLLGQLSRRGNSVANLLARWNRERTSLLRTHGVGRINNVDVSVEVSVNMLETADDSKEALHLLSLCCMLPDGLRPGVFERLRSQFGCIDRARDNLSAFSLANLGTDGVLRTLTPIRHHVLQRHPSQQEHRQGLYLIYFDIAEQLPIDMDESFKERAAVATPEIGNLSTLLLTLVDQPSQHIVDAVVRLTCFEYWQLPSLTVALALLPHLESNSKWKAHCLEVIGLVQISLHSFRPAIDTLRTAAELFIEIANRYLALCRNRAPRARRVRTSRGVVEQRTRDLHSTGRQKRNRTMQDGSR